MLSKEQIMLTKKIFALFMFAVTICLFATTAYAKLPISTSDIPTGISTEPDASNVVLTVSQWIINILGGISILVIIYGGFRYVTAAGNEKKVEKAKEIIKYAVIGLVLVLLAFTIASTVNNVLQGSSGNNSQAQACHCNAPSNRDFNPPQRICTNTPIANDPAGCNSSLQCNADDCTDWAPADDTCWCSFGSTATSKINDSGDPDCNGKAPASCTLRN